MMIRREILIAGACLLMYVGCSQQAGDPPDVVAERCEVCHADVPPRDSATELRIHDRHKYAGPMKRCDKCHLNYDTLNGWTQGAEHRDGKHQPTSDTSQAICKACHDYNDCWKCHNSPYDKPDKPATKRVHDIHYSKLQFACDSCHQGYDPINSVAPPEHDNGTVEVKFGFNPQGLVPVYDGATKTCYNIYCHAASISGGKPSIRITDVMSHTDSTGCSFCHDVGKLRTQVKTHAQVGHNQAMNNVFNDCGNCHEGYSVRSQAVVDSTHINGFIKHISLKQCNECHDLDHQILNYPK